MPSFPPGRSAPPPSRTSSSSSLRDPMNLVIQGPVVARKEADAIASMAKASRLEQISTTAFRLRGAEKSEAIAAFCEARNIDYGWIPEGRRFAALKLVAMDMAS